MMKKLIVISHPEVLYNEAELLVTTLDAGSDYVHLRKPHAKDTDIAKLLQEIPPEYLSKIVLHDAHHLAREYRVAGIHLNRRHPHAVLYRQGMVGISCHTIEEIERYKGTHDYLFLSPIHNSISKAGYNTPFTSEQLAMAYKSGIIDNQIIALGGITPDNISTTLAYGFGGIAILGCIWNNPSVEHITNTIHNIKEQLSCYSL